MLGRTLAYRIRVQANCNQSSVIKAWDDPQLIQTIMKQIESEEHTSIQNKGKSHVSENVHFDTKSLSATAEHDPDQVALITPSKKVSPETQYEEKLSQELLITQLSSTKTAKTHQN